MIGFKNAVGNAGEHVTKQITFSRGSYGFIAFNGENFALNQNWSFF